MADHLPLTLSNAAFVRYDESNMDFLRALLFGAEGTPYAHGCYLFDIFMGDYPTSPPKVNLITTGRDTVRFNPNLYANGYVCLSLLGTWGGQGCETCSAKSNITQVLVSIQIYKAPLILFVFVHAIRSSRRPHLCFELRFTPSIIKPVHFLRNFSSKLYSG